MGRRRGPRKQGAKETYEASPAPQELAEERREREEAVGAVEEFLSRPGVEGRAIPGHGDGAHTENYSKPGHGHNYAEPDHGHPGKADNPHGNDQHSTNYAGADHGHPGKADNPHNNAQHSVNFASANHNHSQSIKLMSPERRAAACALREKIRTAPTQEDLADGLLFVMGLLFDDAEEALDDTLERSADEQLVRHLWESAGVDPGDVTAPSDDPHPDLDRISGETPRGDRR